MEQVIARVIEKQQRGKQDKLAKRVSPQQERLNSESLRKKKKCFKVSSFKADQNWLAIREKLDVHSGQQRKGTSRLDKKGDKNPFKSRVEGDLQQHFQLKEKDISPLVDVGQRNKTMESSNSNRQPLLTKVVALDCEFVGVGKLGKEHSLARVSIVNFKGEVLYDKYVVNNKEPVVDYRTHVSGIRPEHLRSSEAVLFERAQNDVDAIIRNRIVVGHAVHHDLHVLLLSHPRKLIRDTSKWKVLRSSHSKRKTPSLRKLAQEILGISIQEGQHDSVEDARAALMIYKRFAKQWELELQKTSHKSKRQQR